VSKRLQLESVVSVVVPEIADYNSPRGSCHLHTHARRWSGRSATKYYFQTRFSGCIMTRTGSFVEDWRLYDIQETVYTIGGCLKG
jgi:hypothetical protein